MMRVVSCIVPVQAHLEVDTRSSGVMERHKCQGADILCLKLRYVITQWMYQVQLKMELSLRLGLVTAKWEGTKL